MSYLRARLISFLELKAIIKALKLMEEYTEDLEITTEWIDHNEVPQGGFSVKNIFSDKDNLQKNISSLYNGDESIFDKYDFYITIKRTEK